MSSDKDTVIHSGSLTRRCGPKKQKVWQERFFTLCQSNKTRAYYLCYYRTADYTKQQRDVTQSYLPLASPSDSSLITTLYRFDRGMYQRPGYVFALHPGASSTSRRTYLFEAKTLAERDKWIQSLLAHGCQDGGVIMPALQDANALHESWLWVKQSGVLHGWKWRLVALRWNEIRYYKLKDGKFQLNGQMMLSERSLLKPDSSKKHSFTFQSNSSAKPLHFSAHDDHERGAWITAIQRVCESTGKPLTERNREYITSCFMDTPVSIQRVNADHAQDAYLPVTTPTTQSTVDFGYPPVSASTATTNTDPPSTPTSSLSSRPSMSASSRIEESQSSIAHPSAIYSTQMLDAVMIERERELAERESRSRESSVTSDLGSPITSPTASPREASCSTSRDRHISQTPHIMSAKTAQLLSTLTPIQSTRTAYQSRSGPHPIPTARRMEPIVANSRPQLTPAVRLLPNPFEINQIAATPEHRERVISRMPSERFRTGTTSSTSSPPSSSPSHSYSRFTMSSPSSSPPGSTRGFTMTPSQIASYSNIHSPTQTGKPTHERSQTEMITSS